jgi:hypothetical protein
MISAAFALVLLFPARPESEWHFVASYRLPEVCDRMAPVPNQSLISVFSRDSGRSYVFTDAGTLARREALTNVSNSQHTDTSEPKLLALINKRPTHYIDYRVRTVTPSGSARETVARYPERFLAIPGWRGLGALFVSNDERPISYYISPAGTSASSMLFNARARYPARVRNHGVALPNDYFLIIMGIGNINTLPKHTKSVGSYSRPDANRYVACIVHGYSGYAEIVALLNEAPSNSFVVDRADKLGVFASGEAFVILHDQVLMFYGKGVRRN